MLLLSLSDIPHSRDDIQLLAMIFLTGWAWWKGGGPERAIAFTILAMELIDRLYHLIAGPSFELRATDWAHMANDSLILVVCVVVALWANRSYTFYIAGFQLIAVIAHIARSIVPEISGVAYAIMFIGPSYLQLAGMMIGFTLHGRRQKKYGPYRNWRVTSCTKSDRCLGW